MHTLFVMLMMLVATGARADWRPRCEKLLSKTHALVTKRDPIIITTAEPCITDGGCPDGRSLNMGFEIDGAKIELTIEGSRSPVAAGKKAEGLMEGRVFAGWRELRGGFDLGKPTARLTRVEFTRVTLSHQASLVVSGLNVPAPLVAELERQWTPDLDKCLELARKEFGNPACAGPCCSFWAPSPGKWGHPIYAPIQLRQDVECKDSVDGGR